MTTTIFTDDFPFIKTNDKLDLVKQKFPKYDEYYLASGCIKDRKEKFDTLWSEFKPYADSNFLTEVKINFHSRTWEMYVCNVLLHKELNIKLHSSTSNKPKNEGPDFILEDDTYIECIACTKGDPKSSNSVPQIQYARTPEEIVRVDVPTDRMILRITQAIKDKAVDQYKKWKKKEWFNSNSPFIIAINSGDLSFPQDYLGIPLIIKALFGLEFIQISQNGDEGFSFRQSVKKGKSDVPVRYFTCDDFSFISGIIFSDVIVLNHPEEIGNDCVFVNNPFATNTVDNDCFSKFNSFKAEKGKFTKFY